MKDKNNGKRGKMQKIGDILNQLDLSFIEANPKAQRRAKFKTALNN